MANEKKATKRVAIYGFSFIACITLAFKIYPVTLWFVLMAMYWMVEYNAETPGKE